MHESGCPIVYDIAVDPGKPNLLYAASAPWGSSSPTDGGISWRGITEEFTHGGARTTHVLLKKGSSNALLYATDAGNIARSVNGVNRGSVTQGQESTNTLSRRSSFESRFCVWRDRKRRYRVDRLRDDLERGRTRSPPDRDFMSSSREAGPANMVYAYGNGKE